MPAALQNSSTKPVSRNRVADQIFEDLKQQIIGGALPRGAKLPTERELAERYGVSAPTIREAIRGLSLNGLIEVRHGSGAFVTANSEALIAMSLSAVIQLETVGVNDTLSLLNVLNSHAASCAAQRATAADIQRLHDAFEALVDIQTAKQAEMGVRSFHHALVSAAHNPLLQVICGFLADVQIEFAKEITGGDADTWKQMLKSLNPFRAKLVKAIERRDSKAATSISQDFHNEAIRLITSLPKAQEVRMSDPHLASLMASIVRSSRSGRPQLVDTQN